LLAAYDHDIVKFGMGAPAPDMLPAKDFARIAGEVFDPSNFTYGETKGEPILLEALHDYLSSTDQIAAEQKGNLDRLLITSGGMQGLGLGFKPCVRPGDLVACQSPARPSGSATPMSYEADILAVPVADEGMQVEVREEHTARTG